MTMLSTNPSKEIFAKVIKETNTILLVIVHGIMEVIMITATWCCMHATGLPGDRLTGKHTHGTALIARLSFQPYQTACPLITAGSAAAERP